jgi:hypothetical protein
MENAFALTPALTDHARLRCIQMEVNTKRVKRIVLRPTMVVPGPPHYGDNYIATADYDPEIQVAYAVDETGRPVVKTVLWSTPEHYTRPDAKAVTS